jgi:hypothetical protein
MKQRFLEETPERVHPERALEHAKLTIRRDWAAGVHGFERWHRVEINPEPLVLYDLNGAELFYEFMVNFDDKIVGAIKTSASRSLGSPVVAVEMGPLRWDPERAIRLAREKAGRQHEGAEVVGTALVCFSYPKVGVRVDLSEGHDEFSVIYDAASLSRITRFGDDRHEGVSAWSFYEEIVQRDEDRRLRRWDLAERELEAVSQRNERVFESAFTDREADNLRDSFRIDSRYKYFPAYSSRVLKYGPRCSPHDCFMLYSQQTDVYCAVATGQMILDFHRWPFTQDQIAAAMGTDATGTGLDGQVAGYESLTNNSFDATLDSAPDWSAAKAEIDANRPLKSGISGHARACTGWKSQNVFLVTQPPRRWLQIYNPWPWNEDICQGGAIVWEDWDAVTHTNFIYVRHA